MFKFIEGLKFRYHYVTESIKNRYPCAIIDVGNIDEKNFEITITYQAVTKINIKKTTLKEIIDDPLLVEKFHPTDCIKMGFLAAADILLKNDYSLEVIREKYGSIVNQMFRELSNASDKHK